MTRQPLPNRRQQLTTALAVNGQAIQASVGFDGGNPREIFLTGAKVGSDMAAELEAASVVISLALQHGIKPQELARSVPENCIIGAALNLLCEMVPA